MNRTVLSPTAFVFTLWMLVVNANGSEPYCGVYCLYAGSDALGVKTDFDSLLSNRYVTDGSGSSLDSLALAATGIGLSSRRLSGLGRLDLQCAQTPVILHVRSDSTRPDFDHWVLFLGRSHGKAKIVDPNIGELQMPFEELLTLWDGAGLAISRSSFELQVWQFSVLLVRVLFLCLFALLVQFVLKKWASSQHGNGVVHSPLLGSLWVLFLLAIVGVVMDHFAGGRLLANPYPTISMANLYVPVSFPEIEHAKLAELLDKPDSKDIVLIDARMAKDYRYSPLPNAISIPMDGSPIGETDSLRSIDKRARLVVYCQSSGCTYSDVVSKRLRARGYSNITIYRGGAADWRNALLDKASKSLTELQEKLDGTRR